jgi:glycosyltransferase 2 family protein
MAHESLTPAPPPPGAPAEQAASRPRARALAVPVVVGAGIGITCLVFVVARMTQQWGVVRDEIADASWVWIGAALVCAAGAMTWIAACWQRVLALLGPPPERGRTVAWYFAGEIGKYVPGGVWPVLGRGELARRGGVPRSTAYPSVGLSLAALYLAALALAAALVPLDLAGQASSPGPLLLLLLLPAGLLVLHPRVLRWGRDLLVRFTGKGRDIYIPPWRGTIGLVISYLPAWLLIWAATWCTARALLPDPPVLRIGIATTLSWVAGFAAVPVPAGAGVREAVFVASSGLPAGIGATIAIGSRLVFLLADVAGAAFSAPWHRGARAERP